MSLTKAQCPNCSGLLEVDASKEVAVCPFCNTPYIVEKAINNYTTNVVNNIHAGTVVVQGTSDADFEIEGVTLIKYTGHSKEIVIPDYVEKIEEKEEKAFPDFLRSITIPASVTSISELAFLGCGDLTSLTVQAGNSNYHSSGNCLIETKSKTLIKGCNGSVIPTDGSVTSIGRGAFWGCTSLTSITIPDSVTSIGKNAFGWCTGLTSITIPDSVTSIGGEVFYCCTNLTSVDLGNNVTVIGGSAFWGCTGLTSITIPDSVTGIGKWAFKDCKSLTSVIIGSGAAAGNGAISIGDEAFLGCKGLTSVTFGNSVESIGQWAFNECKSLTSVTFGNSVTSIGKWAFNECKSLTSVTFGNSLTSIGDDAFFSCEGLTSITFPDGLTSIGENAFYYCTSLTSVTIPASVTSIGKWAFSGCHKLTNVSMLCDRKAIGDNAFSGTPVEKQYKANFNLPGCSNFIPGCYVATCVYGSYDCPQVWTLRRYRDDTLGATWYGRAFIRVYYAVSPTLVKWFGRTKWFKKLWRGKLDRMVKRLNAQGVADTPYQDREW